MEGQGGLYGAERIAGSSGFLAPRCVRVALVLFAALLEVRELS